MQIGVVNRKAADVVSAKTRSKQQIECPLGGLNMKCTISSMCRLLLPAAMLACSLSTSALAADGPEILVLSNRADLISGGDALVQINLPASVNPAFAKVALNGGLINGMFAVRPNGRFQGLVTGLRDGDNLLTVNTPPGRAKITIPNHPIGGPVFSGAQLQPWICATVVAQTVSVIGNPGSTPPTATATTSASGLSSDPIDVQCD